MIKILFFIDELSGGGAEKVLRTLVNNMDRSKFEVTVQTVEPVDPAEYLVPGIRYKAINRAKSKIGKKLMSCWIRLCAELKWLYPLYIRDSYDIEIAYLECGPTKMLAGSTNKDAVRLAWVHCDLEKKGFGNPDKVRQYYKTYDKVVCVSEDVRKAYVRLFGNRPEALVLYNVNDEAEILEKADAFLPEDMFLPTIVSVGRLSFEKGNDRLLEACRLLQEDGYVFRLWLVGDGPERKNLEKMVLDYGLEKCVLFWGFQKNPYPYMKASSFLVVPSRYEGFSTVVTEALILGKPVVTTPCSGMDELLGDSEYGLITEDTTEGIYAGLKRVLDDPQLLEHYAQMAAVRSKDFSKEQLLKQTEQFFEDLL